MGKATGSKGLVAALLVGGIAAAGCVTTSKEFKLAYVRPGKTAIAGRLTVVYNGQVYTDNCVAKFGARLLRLTRDGIVLLVVPVGRSDLEELRCQDGSMQHVKIKGVPLVARPGVVNDFGDVVVSWEAVGGLKISQLFGVIGGLIDVASDDGVATSVVRPPVAEVREAFKRQTGVAGVWSVPLVPVVPLVARPASAPPGAQPASAPVRRDPAPGVETCTGPGPDLAALCGELR